MHQLLQLFRQEEKDEGGNSSQRAASGLCNQEALRNISSCPMTINTLPQKVERRIPQYLSATYPPISGVRYTSPV
ncbi:MAG: hypothetical protein JJE08_03140 [Proteiniphilum sp.]|nr:hypothetical protein [Proteiniphilum sp.]